MLPSLVAVFAQEIAILLREDWPSVKGRENLWSFKRRWLYPRRWLTRRGKTVQKKDKTGRVHAQENGSARLV